MPINFVTGNINKFKEALKFIPDLIQVDLDLPEIQSLDPKEIIQAKAEVAAIQVKGALIIEDTSLTFMALNGLPGPLIKWFLNSIGTTGLSELASHLESREAIATTSLGFVNDNGSIKYFTGETQGLIVPPRGKTTFGWDPIFQPENTIKTYAEMTLDEKNSISHRSKAFLKLKDYLQI